MGRKLRLLLLFSSGMSVEAWASAGYLAREIKIYSLLSRAVGEIWWYTYGINDLQYDELLKKHGIYLFPIERDLLKRSYSSSEYDRLMLSKYRTLFSQFDVVKTNQFSSWKLAAAIKRSFGVPFILRRGFWHPLRFRVVRRNPLAGFREFLHERSAYKLADKVVLTSEEARVRVTRLFPLAKEKITVIRNAIDVETFKPGGRKHETGHWKLLFIGRLVYAKAPDLLLKSLRYLQGPPVTVTVIGKGRYKARLKEIARRSRHDIRFIDQVEYDALPAVYKEHSIFVLPSRWEGNPKVLLEAMACGLCVVGRNTFGVREVIQHLENGILFNNGAKSLACSLDHIRKTPGLCAQLGRKARKYILDNNRLEKVLEEEVRLIREVAR